MLDEIEALLQQTIGLDAVSIGPSAIEYAVRTRISACQLSDLSAYWAYLQQSGTELQELIDVVVVPETWFFRDREALAAMARAVLDDGRRGRAPGPCRLLSLPCSSGEEPYSMAIALLEVGVAPDRFLIDAFDVSSRAVAAARQAIYGKNAFRGGDLSFRDRYFDAVADGFRPIEAVRRQVRFAQGNMLDPALLPGAGLYDIIFCRNVLIYFARATQEQAFRVLLGLLAPGGLLFVGPAEAGLPPRTDFVSAKLPMAFAFRKMAVGATDATVRPVKRTLPSVSAARRPASPPIAPAQRPAAVPPTHQAGRPAAATRQSGIATAQSLADQGHLVEAALHCEDYLRSHGPAPEAFYLLGLIRDATGNHREATDFYRKALYLDPNHGDALIHLALLLERQGDPEGAKALNERSRRLAERSRL
jgi:chemotaxis protein methyltransferase WspC